MPRGDVVRYYPAFRPAVPEPGVRWRSITHPSATGRPLRAAPSDLHVLATPPAFRLSQDQTLQLDFASPRRSSRVAARFPGGLISKRVCPSHPRQDGRECGFRRPGGWAGTPIGTPSSPSRAEKANRGCFARLKHLFWLKTLSKLIKDRSLLKRSLHHKDARDLGGDRPPSPKPRRREPAKHVRRGTGPRILRPGPRDFRRGPGAHTLAAYPTLHFSKSYRLVSKPAFTGLQISP